MQNSLELPNGDVKKSVEHRKLRGSAFVDSLGSFPTAHPKRRSPALGVIQGVYLHESQTICYVVSLSCVFHSVACIKHELDKGEVLPKDHERILAGLSDTKSHIALSSYLEEQDGIAPVLAILGGIMVNDIIKILTKKGEPSIQNFFVYSTLDDAGWIERGVSETHA